MQKETASNYHHSESTSQQKNTTPIGFDEIGLEERESLKWIAEFITKIPEINKLSEFEATVPLKKKEKTLANVRNNRKQRDGLF